MGFISDDAAAAAVDITVQVVVQPCDSAAGGCIRQCPRATQQLKAAPIGRAARSSRISGTRGGLQACRELALKQRNAIRHTPYAIRHTPYASCRCRQARRRLMLSQADTPTKSCNGVAATASVGHRTSPTRPTAAAPCGRWRQTSARWGGEPEAGASKRGSPGAGASFVRLRTIGYTGSARTVRAPSEQSWLRPALRAAKLHPRRHAESLLATRYFRRGPRARWSLVGSQGTTVASTLPTRDRRTACPDCHSCRAWPG